MLTLRKPGPEIIREFLTSQSKLEHNYSAVGATATTPPSGFVVDRTRIQLGAGEADFHSAKIALKRWEQFQLGWVQPCSEDTSIQAGSTVGILARCLGLWWLNACRIVYVVDEKSPMRRFGFAYGTLPGHAEMGEERFLVEWEPGTNSVWYDILAFSRPKHALARLGYPWARRMQKRFAADSAAAMLRAVSGK